jgi:AraC-like DNA-binding protein
MITLQLRDSPASELWKAGQRLAAGPFVAGSIVIAHLEDEPSFNLHDSFDMLLVHVPQIVFDELADDHGAPRIGQFIDQAGAMDAVVHDLGRALLPSIGASIRESQLFDHITIAIYARLATRFGLLQPPQPSSGRRLTARQERVAKEALVADLTRQPVMEKVALACGLPVSRLIRAFRNTTGVQPHSWLRSFRVERAKDLLLNSSLSLGQIAYECGFADQSHLTRTFSAAVGTTPGAWRRARRA